MNISIINLVYLMAGAVLAGELGDMFLKSREWFWSYHRHSLINIRSSTGGSIPSSPAKKLSHPIGEVQKEDMI